MDEKQNIRTELHDAPTLRDLPKKNPFTVPDLYFQKLSEKTFERIEKRRTFNEQLAQKLNDLFKLLFQPRIAIPIAASLVIIAIAVGWFQNDMNADIEKNSLAEVSSVAINNYIVENFEEDDLINFNGNTLGKSDIIFSNEISTEELNEYLLNNSDNQLLEEEML